MRLFPFRKLGLYYGEVTHTKGFCEVLITGSQMKVKTVSPTLAPYAVFFNEMTFQPSSLIQDQYDLEAETSSYERILHMEPEWATLSSLSFLTFSI